MPKKRTKSLSPREYQKRLDFCKLRGLVCMGKTQAQIAQEMHKDPAWVSRSIKEIHADFSHVFSTPDESRLIDEKLLKLQGLFADAMNTAQTSFGHVRISALRLAAEISQQETAFHLAVGLIRKAPSNVRVAGMIGVTGNQPDMELLRGEFQDGDLEQITLELADAIREKQSEAACIKVSGTQAT